MPLHEIVCYQKEDRNWEKVLYHDLVSQELRSFLRTQYLYDSPEKAIEPGIKNRKDSLFLIKEEE